jgi:hypothetical protein
VPFTTPVLSEDGRLLGAVNILVRTSPVATAAELRAQARRWRRLALSVDPQTARELEALGSELERQADQLTRRN